MLLVSLGKGDTMIVTTSLEEFLIHAPKPDGLGFPLEATSKFNFQNPYIGVSKYSFELRNKLVID